LVFELITATSIVHLSRSGPAKGHIA
jgi:hypothetical protein